MEIIITEIRPGTGLEIKHFEWRDLALHCRISPLGMFYLEIGFWSYFCYSVLQMSSSYLVKLLETDHVCVFTEGLSGHVQTIFLDQTNSFLAIDTTVTVTFTESILALSATYPLNQVVRVTGGMVIKSFI